MLENLKKEKYPRTDYNHIDILKSVTYFDDPDAQSMPKMYILVGWEGVKENILEQVKEF
jgi:hypothetical protein